MWPGDFDGDGEPDWCVATTSGVACGVAAESAITTDGATWSFSYGGTADADALSYASVGVGDVDGDGRADLCSLAVNAIKCARSQGRAFGPRATFAVLPAAANALWTGDLDGDGRADACAETSDMIVCALF